MPRQLDFNGHRAGSPLRINNKSATEAEIIVYAGIGQDWWNDGSMISAKQFSDELKKIPDTVNTLNIRLNSPGGDVFEGVAIYNRLKQHKAKKVVHIDGLAASIASIIAMAGDEVIMGEGALMMIHLPWTFAMGNRMELDSTINRLLDIEEQMLSIYTKRTKMDRGEIRALLEKETWFSAEEAIEKKFADKESETTVAIAASAVKSPWISKRPENYFSDKEATQKKINEIRNKISSLVTR